MTEGAYIIVVDDEPEMQRMLKRALELEGCAVSIVGSSREAIDLLEMLTPDLVILNISMSDSDSLHVLDLIRQNTGVHIIMLTAHNEINTTQEVQSLGADDYISKPLHTEEFLNRVRKQLEAGSDSVPHNGGDDT